MLQVTQIRIAGDPSYDTRYAFIEFMTPEEVRWCPSSYHYPASLFLNVLKSHVCTMCLVPMCLMCLMCLLGSL